MKRILILALVVLGILAGSASPAQAWGRSRSWCDVWILRELPQEPVQRWDVVPACKHIRRAPRGLPAR